MIAYMMVSHGYMQRSCGYRRPKARIDVDISLEAVGRRTLVILTLLSLLPKA